MKKHDYNLDVFFDNLKLKVYYPKVEYSRIRFVEDTITKRNLRLSAYRLKIVQVSLTIQKPHLFKQIKVRFNAGRRALW